eukprot:TRINITY_DN7395_c0_g1_i1.p1 TRINITY_DN7395_c0_g1~~TRINITY_DN7395_c0_g1_i1.p1  ORF type:complete len:396 (-),score=84.54 TRINITY_DN7395_c0_g1_i1:178-1254(-)
MLQRRAGRGGRGGGGHEKKKKRWREELEGEGEVEASAEQQRAYEELQRDLREREAFEAENRARLKKEEEEAAARARKEREELRRRRPQVYLEVGTAARKDRTKVERPESIGRLVFELFADAVPKTCKNFRSLCAGDGALTYVGCPFHRIIPGFMAQGGDITRHDGTGGESIYGLTFEDENLSLVHSERGTLSMANSGPDTNSSQFFVTFGAPSWLDGKHVVFGRMLDGMDVLAKMEECGTAEGKPKELVVIISCGEVQEEEKIVPPELQEEGKKDEATMEDPTEGPLLAGEPHGQVAAGTRKERKPDWEDPTEGPLLVEDEAAGGATVGEKRPREGVAREGEEAGGGSKRQRMGEGSD